MQDLHDRGYKKLFSNLEIFQQLVTTFVTEPWVKELDFSTCELLKGSFVSKAYKASFSDLIYKIKWRDDDLFLVILLEFKSAPYQFVALQILGYIVDFYRQLIDSGKNVRKLPPVFAMLLYNGEQQWDAPKDVAELIQDHEALGEYALHFKYFPINENDYDKELLLQIGNIVSTLFLAEAHYDLELLKQELLKLFEKSPNKQAVSLFLNWLKELAVYGRIEQSDYEILDRVYQDTKEVSMLINSIEKERKQLYEKGWGDGRETGKAEGKAEGRREKLFEFARVMLASGEPLEKIKLYTSLTDEDLMKLHAETAQN